MRLVIFFNVETSAKINLTAKHAFESPQSYRDCVISNFHWWELMLTGSHRVTRFFLSVTCDCVRTPHKITSCVIRVYKRNEFLFVSSRLHAVLYTMLSCSDIKKIVSPKIAKCGIPTSQIAPFLHLSAFSPFSSVCQVNWSFFKQYCRG